MPNSSDKSGCLFAIFKLLAGGSSASEDDALPYRQRDDFLSPAEISFFRVMCNVVGDQAVICPKVRLADILFVVDRRRHFKHANRINQKHVDFLLCDPTSMRPIGAVELDDSSHARSDREERDEFVDRAFEAAGLRVVRVKARQGYRTDEIAALIAPLLKGESVVGRSSQPLPAVKETTTPTCPKCGVPMMLRTAKRGTEIGHQFWGCVNYPKCREIVAVSNQAAK